MTNLEFCQVAESLPAKMENMVIWIKNLEEMTEFVWDDATNFPIKLLLSKAKISGR